MGLSRARAAAWGLTPWVSRVEEKVAERLGHAPSDVRVPEARRMPWYRGINDPFRTLQERAYVTSEATMADVLLPQAPGA